LIDSISLVSCVDELDWSIRSGVATGVANERVANVGYTAQEYM